MTKLTSGPRPGAGLMSEANGNRSREVVIIAAGSGKVEPGTILGEITASKKFSPSPDASVTGLEGAEVGKAIAIYGCNAVLEDQELVVIRRDAEWNVHHLRYDATVDTDAKKAVKIAQLAAAGIIAR